MDETPLGDLSGGGCGIWIIGAIMVCAICIGLAMAPKNENFGEVAKRGVDRSGNDTAQFASGNEVMSRNQLNLWSDVENNFLDCNGYGACIVNTDNSVTTTNTESTTTNTDSRSSTTVEGDRNVVIGSNGDRLCADPTTGIYSLCQEGQ